MKLAQIVWNGRITAAIVDGDNVRPIPEHTVQDLVRRADIEGAGLAEVAGARVSSHAESVPLVIPIEPREVWACGCTYQMSAAFRDGEHGTREGFYAYVYREPRPEIFFKGTSRVCVGPGQPIGIRFDSKFTAPEPELAVLIGSHGRILAYTLANDVSAWDIERENPLYLPQSKVYNGCCSLGPVLVTADAIPDPYSLQMSCTITRGGRVLFGGEVATSRLNRKLESLVEYLLYANSVPSGSVLLTGTGIIVTEDCALAEGDVVRIHVAEIGELANPCVIVR